MALSEKAVEVHSRDIRDICLLEESTSASFHHHVVGEEVPEFQTNFKQFVFGDLAELNEVIETMLSAFT